MKVYKIRNPEGLFSRGGSTPQWSKNGKTWSGIGPLKSHLTMIRYENDHYKKPLYNPYEGCEVLEFTYVQTQSAVLPIKDMKI